MDAILLELAKQIPSAVAVIGVVYLFLKHDQQKDTRREANAAQLILERRQHEIALNTIWADRFNNVVEAMRKSMETIQNDIREHDETSENRYKRLQVTRDLLKEASKQKQNPK